MKSTVQYTAIQIVWCRWYWIGWVGLIFDFEKKAKVMNSDNYCTMLNGIVMS